MSNTWRIIEDYDGLRTTPTTRGLSYKQMDEIVRVRDCLYGEPPDSAAVTNMMRNAVYQSNLHLGHAEAMRIAENCGYLSPRAAAAWQAEHVLRLPPGSPGFREHLTLAVGAEQFSKGPWKV